MSDIMTYGEFELFEDWLCEMDKDIAMDLDNKYEFFYGTHSSMFGSYRGFWIRDQVYPGGAKNTIDSINYSLEEFYEYLIKNNLLKDLKFKVEEHILKNV